MWIKWIKDDEIKIFNMYNNLPGGLTYCFADIWNLCRQKRVEYFDIVYLLYRTFLSKICDTKKTQLSILPESRDIWVRIIMCPLCLLKCRFLCIRRTVLCVVFYPGWISVVSLQFQIPVTLSVLHGPRPPNITCNFLIVIFNVREYSCSLTWLTHPAYDWLVLCFGLWNSQWY